MIIEIPQIEFKQKIANIHAAMRQEGYDLLLAFGNETEPQFVRYYSDYWPSFETTGVLIPAEGNPFLLIGLESLTYASDRSKISDIRLLRAFRESSEPEYPGKVLDSFESVNAKVLKGKQLNRFIVAVLSLMTVGIFEILRQSLSSFGARPIEKAYNLVVRLNLTRSDKRGV